MFLYPHAYTPTPEARQAARLLMERVRAYMDAHPDSELHRRGKMFGVLLADDARGERHVLDAFSAMLDGSYDHEGFVEPIFRFDPTQIVGTDADDSRAKQQWLFSQYRLLNALGECRTVLDCFRDEPTFGSYPPSGTGECCAPKLLQAAYLRDWKPVSMAEFWMGASPRDEIRREGEFYPACIAKCRPLLRHMLRGIAVEENPLVSAGRRVAAATRILYSDDDLWVISKPSGLLAVPGREGQYSVVDFLGGGQPAHRLDMDTSGLMIVARNDEALRHLQSQFVRHEVRKIYLAELEDTRTCATQEPEGLISLPLIANPLDRPRQIVDWQHGKRSVTRYRMLTPTLVALYPETGRTHQLRVHCAHPDGLGAPIVGDRLYGCGGDTPLRLHATRIEFTHPRTGQTLSFEDYPSWSPIQSVC